MKQILQNISDGKTKIEDVPVPKLSKDTVLINSTYSLISSGTEKMLVDFGKGSYIDKARQQPDKVKMVLDKIKVDGIKVTYDAVKSKLDEPIPLGYCNAGFVMESGTSVFKKGDRVISNGYHAEVVRVGKNLCAKIPDNVDDESASFTVLASISLQGIRLIQPNIGETVVVSGLGLVGLLAVQILIANGCKVIGIDFDSSRCQLAENFGAISVDLSKGEDPEEFVNLNTNNIGADAILIAASTKSDEVIHQAAQMCRQRGKIVLIGVIGLNLRRDDFFKKEITFQVSASYGPGRYDPAYEESGIDYPIGFVRWTEKRNFEAVLDMMSRGTIDVKPLISKILPIEDALDAYTEIHKGSSLGTLIKYPNQPSNRESKSVILKSKDNLHIEKNKAVVGFIGAGNYASRTLIPSFVKAGALMHTLVTSGGMSGVQHGKKWNFHKTSTDTENLWRDKEINTIVIATRHNTHASLIIKALTAGKNVFVEKPLALNLKDIEDIEKTYRQINNNSNSKVHLMVGFNRRFSPLSVKLKSLLDKKTEPKSIIMTVNAGKIEESHWAQNKEIGGGRIIGEGCHFIDLMRFLIGSKITSYSRMTIGNSPAYKIRDDKVSINLSFDDGSIGTIHYLANGGKVFQKERIEVFSGDDVIQLNNFRSMEGFGSKFFKKMKLWNQDKGQINCVKEFIAAVEKGNPTPIPIDEIFEVSKETIKIANEL